MSGKVIVGVDASRSRSGGGIAHIKGIFSSFDPRELGIKKVHLWAFKELHKELEDAPWLVRHCPRALSKGIFWQLLWQRYTLPKEIKKNNCEIILNTDASSILRFNPSITMSRDMLSYEPGEMKRYGLSKSRLRLELIKILQNRSLVKSSAALFLTEYASRVIQKSSGKIQNFKIIPHGVGKNFKSAHNPSNWPFNKEKPIEILYVSNVAWYKHQWNVVDAIYNLRNHGHNISLRLIGGGKGKPYKILKDKIDIVDPAGEYIFDEGFISNDNLGPFFKKANIFIFASSCENMPNTLIEAMSTGIPILCSDRGPMPEVLKDGGLYFDPESVHSIENSIKIIINDENLRNKTAIISKKLSEKYSWERCAQETWAFLLETRNI